MTSHGSTLRDRGDGSGIAEKYSHDMNGPLRLPTIPTKSRRERVADAIRNAIVDGSLEPGQRLTEIELCTQLGTSRAPVREALRQLELEGLVASYPYRGTEVLGVSQQEIEHVLVPVRLTLERFAFAAASKHIDAEVAEKLNVLVEEMRSAAHDPAQLADTDIQFHEMVMELAGQPHCLQIWRTIQPRVRAYFRRDATYYDDPKVVADQHSLLLAALTAGDPDALDNAVVEHIRTHFAEGRET